ncbi:hypothetical protein FJV41_19740 [Myxococcus llanfairpwllgwyngyllgogerychwyrndrobwllllantysiliogogogochensis]|uniref:Uncharacterized protein n=1 Tax=Myxococcus llanfairpwllgwyngyllgogerychwyrndrobwllllantysiliogogogochensis TaxID=2590453 RepID=A0A540X0F0_9BACT|nr:hypothetical protein [Myxococcus llanfairpwllgwyngyllgogerychwyrndrobwllllantysiliogogogochensis]TQF14204.1 hypothetical protein FJV41_19740 [Myxococcus llanfairpwllgwyngyllgogerychwyrndrobwllllantysiliogogogochensis]
MTSLNLYSIAYDLNGEQTRVKDALKAVGFRATADGNLGHATPLPDTLLFFEAKSEDAVEAAFDGAIRAAFLSPPIVTKIAIMKLAAPPVVKARDEIPLRDFVRALIESKG